MRNSNCVLVVEHRPDVIAQITEVVDGIFGPDSTIVFDEFSRHIKDTTHQQRTNAAIVSTDYLDYWHLGNGIGLNLKRWGKQDKLIGLLPHFHYVDRDLHYYWEKKLGAFAISRTSAQWERSLRQVLAGV